MDAPRVYRGLLLFGVIIHGVYRGELAFDLARLIDARLLVIVLPSFAAFADIWLRKRWGPILAVASSLLDVFWWGWLANYAARRYGDIGAFIPEYIFFAMFYGFLTLLAIREFRNLSPKNIEGLINL